MDKLVEEDRTNPFKTGPGAIEGGGTEGSGLENRLFLLTPLSDDASSNCLLEILTVARDKSHVKQNLFLLLLLLLGMRGGSMGVPSESGTAVAAAEEEEAQAGCVRCFPRPMLRPSIYGLAAKSPDKEASADDPADPTKEADRDWKDLPAMGPVMSDPIPRSLPSLDSISEVTAFALPTAPNPALPEGKPPAPALPPPENPFLFFT